MPTRRNKNKPNAGDDPVDHLANMQTAIDGLAQRIDDMEKKLASDDDDDDNERPDLIWDAETKSYFESWPDDDEDEGSEVLQVQ